MNDDNLMQAATKLKKDIRPQRDLWPNIAATIEQPARRRWSPMLAQAAALVLLIGATSGITYFAVKGSGPVTVIATADMIFEQASFGNQYQLGEGFHDARNALVADLEVELQRLPPESRKNIESNLTIIRSAVNEMNRELENDPENLLLQERLLNTYGEELALLRRVSGLSRNVMLRNDI